MIDIQNIQIQIADRLRECAADFDWKSVQYEVRGAARYYESRDAVVTDASGELHDADPLSADALFVDLRRAMYAPATGTWYSALAVLDESGLQLSFNYEDDPAWDVPPDDVTLAQDQEMFPRDNEHLPFWHPLKE